MHPRWVGALALLVLCPAVLQGQPPTAAAEPGVSDSVGTRLELLTEPMLGKPYRRSPLGEGSGRDPDPRLRFDAFDCTTFVETALAMLAAPSIDQTRATLDRLRYADGRVEYESRLHLVAAQWLPQLQRDAVLEDITEEIGKGEVESLMFEPRRHWDRSVTASRLGLPAEVIPEGEFHLAYLRWAVAERLLAEWPEPVVLNVVRAPSDREPLLVRHQALLLPRREGAIVRHASQRQGRVVDQEWGEFVRSFAGRAGTPGVNVQRILTTGR